MPLSPKPSSSPCATARRNSTTARPTAPGTITTFSPVLARKPTAPLPKNCESSCRKRKPPRHPSSTKGNRFDPNNHPPPTTRIPFPNPPQPRTQPHETPASPPVPSPSHLCHFLRVEPDSDLRETLQRVVPLLWRVSISGADRDGTDWTRLIQPLDAGDFSQAAFLSLLDEVGYERPVGLQCFGIQLPPSDHLERSITAWKQLHQ